MDHIVLLNRFCLNQLFIIKKPLADDSKRNHMFLVKTKILFSFETKIGTWLWSSAKPDYYKKRKSNFL